MVNTSSEAVETDRSVLDVTFDHFPSLGIFPSYTRSEHKAIGHNCLVVNSRTRLGGTVGANWDYLGGHDGLGICRVNVSKLQRIKPFK